MSAADEVPEAGPECETAGHRLQIEYCTQCRWLPRAAWLAQELLGTFDRTELVEVALRPGIGGVFVVRVDGEVVWDRREQGFPEPTAVKRAVRDRVAPGRTLGHSERQAPGGDSPS
ncbi:SelT/SelW/SelH family protein [Streptomyces sp. WMMC940]|uniref:SelT/SelW/SelH family protein n=1 Tax=Streptomyces sp. WMMC940 TaxID=3015153 RepID=UPI0022B741EB|nr:SelT/SelW/SelH family protein [Streptomyces sp. WMMC940]MCZ7457133.1 SelT/SelW/SelH family protein [Streptomyces sp. WMMC940]